jgi:hypothetical protein
MPRMNLKLAFIQAMIDLAVFKRFNHFIIFFMIPILFNT